MQVVPPVGQICNKCKCTNASGTIWWPNLEQMHLILNQLSVETIIQVTDSIPCVRCGSGNVLWVAFNWINSIVATMSDCCDTLTRTELKPKSAIQFIWLVVNYWFCELFPERKYPEYVLHKFCHPYQHGHSAWNTLNQDPTSSMILTPTTLIHHLRLRQ